MAMVVSQGRGGGVEGLEHFFYLCFIIKKKFYYKKPRKGKFFVTSHFNYITGVTRIDRYFCNIWNATQT